MGQGRVMATVGKMGVVIGAVLFLAPVGDGVSAQDAVGANFALVTALTEGRETCYSAPECPNLEQLMALFSDSPRRTEIQRDNRVVLLEGGEALRGDHLRVAGRFTGRRLETIALQAQGRNVIALQRNWDPGAPEPIPFISVFRIEDGKVAHWVLVAP